MAPIPASPPRRARVLPRATLLAALAAAAAATPAAALAAQVPAAPAAPAAPAPVAPDTLPWRPRVDTVLTLPDVIARALAANPAAVQGTAGLRTARSEVRVARGELLPSLSANSALVRSDVTTGSTPVGSSGASSYSAGLSSSMEVFTGGRRGADRERADADYVAAEAGELSQRYAVTLLAQRAFFESLRGAELVTVATARVARAERGVKFAQDRVRAGAATRSDELRARLELTSGRQQLLAARDTAQSAAYALGRVVGSDGPVGAAAPDTLRAVPLLLGDSEIVRLAVEGAPAVRGSEAAARATEANRRAARSQYLPDVRLTGGYNAANQAVVAGGVRPGWQLAVGTSFPLFNGYQREDAVIRADAAAEVARAVALDTRRQVRSDASRLLGALTLAGEAIALGEEAVTAAREDLRVQTQRYRAGISTALDQLTSELAVTQAELSLVAARYNYQLTRAALEALVGRPL